MQINEERSRNLIEPIKEINIENDHVNVECVVDIFMLVRGEWKNQISVIGVVILGPGVV